MNSVGWPGNRLGNEPSAYVVRCRTECIKAAAPAFLAGRQQRDRKCERLPIGINHEMQQHAIRFEAHRRGQALLGIAPVGSAELHAVPFDAMLREELV